MGLLDAFNSDEGRLGLGLLAAAGPSQMGFGERLQSVMSGMDAHKRAQAQSKLLDTQMQVGLLGLDKAKREASTEAQMADLARRYYSPGTPATGLLDGSLPPEMRTGAVPTPAQPAGFDLKGYANALMGVDPLKGIAFQQSLAKDKPINKLDVKDFTPASVQKFAQTGNYGDLVRMDKLHFADTGGAVAGLDPFTGRQVGAVDKTGNPFSDLLVSDGQGGLRPNQPLIGAKQSIAKSGATQVRIENKMGEGVAAQVGPMLRESFNAANGAAQQVDAANRIIAAVDTNKMFAGPGAGIRMKTAQVAQMLGIGGKDDAEKIANTRQAIRGLSEMTLQGRKQMTGQGAITESEGALAEKAQSGNIEDLTAAEIKQLAQASARAARFIYGQHEQMVSNVAADPNTANLAKFYKPLPMPNGPKVAAPAAQVPQPGAGVRFLGFE